MSQSKISSVITDLLEIFEKKICPVWINLQRSEEDVMRTKLFFLENYTIPGVVGCVDGTHVRIMSPGDSVKHMYLNRKGFYSLNVMVVRLKPLKVLEDFFFKYLIIDL